MRHHNTLWLMIGFAATTQVANAAPAERLKSMDDSMRKLNYQGMVVIQQGAQMETLKLVHAFQNGREREYVKSMSGECREVIRNDEQTMCILPQKRLVISEKRQGERRGVIPDLGGISIATLQKYYALDEAATAVRVADRDCINVTITPRDQLRYGYQFCLDAKTGLPLRVELRNERGQMLENIMFSHIEIGAAIPESAFATSVNTKGFANQQDSAPKPDPALRKQWQFELPAGFSIVESQWTQKGAMGGSLIPHFVFSDGLASVSLFVAGKNAPDKMMGAAKMGSSNMLSTKVGEYHITIMGEVPAATIKKIADGAKSMQ